MMNTLIKKIIDIFLFRLSECGNVRSISGSQKIYINEWHRGKFSKLCPDKRGKYVIMVNHSAEDNTTILKMF